MSSRLCPTVTRLVEDARHPLADAIARLRQLILDSDKRLIESVKWNGPNYSVEGQDRITLRLHPPRQIQMILHRGAKPLPSPPKPLVDGGPLLSWKGNDRAIAAFKSLADVEVAAAAIGRVVPEWIDATCTDTPPRPEP